MRIGVIAIAKTSLKETGHNFGRAFVNIQESGGNNYKFRLVSFKLGLGNDTDQISKQQDYSRMMYRFFKSINLINQSSRYGHPVPGDSFFFLNRVESPKFNV